MAIQMADMGGDLLDAGGSFIDMQREDEQSRLDIELEVFRLLVTRVTGLIRIFVVGAGRLTLKVSSSPALLPLINLTGSQFRLRRVRLFT